MTTDLEQRLRRTLDEDAGEAPRVERAPAGLRRRVRRRQAGTATAAVAGLAAVVALTFAGLQAFDGDDRFAPQPSGQSERPVFERTATIDGFTVTGPSDWYLVNRTGSIANTFEWGGRTVGPVFEMTTFDPGLDDAVCGVGEGADNPLPAGGVAIFVGLSTDGFGTDDEPCGNAVIRRRDGRLEVEESLGGGTIDYTIWLAASGEAVDEEQLAQAQAIFESIRTLSPWRAATCKETPGYVLWGGIGPDGSDRRIEVRPSEENVELTHCEEYEAGGGGMGSISGFDVPPKTVDGNFMGIVTEKAEGVEFRPDDGGSTVSALITDLPPSLGYEADAYVFLEGGPTGDDLVIDPLSGDLVAVLPGQEPRPDLTLPTGDVADLIGYGEAAGDHEYRIVLLTGGAVAATSPIGVVGRVEVRPVESEGPWEVVDVHPFVKPDGAVVEFDGVTFGRNEDQGYDSLIVYGLAYEPTESIDLRENGGPGYVRDALRPAYGVPPTVVGAFTLNQTLDDEWRIDAISGESSTGTDIDHGEAIELIDHNEIATMAPTGDVETGGVTYALSRWAGRGVGSDATCVALRSGSEVLAVRCISDLVARDLPIAWHLDLPGGGEVVYGTTPGDGGWIEGDGTMVAEIRDGTFVGVLDHACAKPFLVVQDEEFQVPAAYDCPLSDSRPQ